MPLEIRLAVSSMFALFLGTNLAAALPTTEVPNSEPAYLAKVKTAAPVPIVAKANIVMKQADGSMKTLQAGNNGYTCMINAAGTPLCADENGLAWIKALAAKQDPPDKVGFIYMLAGDTGTNNADAHDETHQHWVATGPHVMVVGPMVKEMAGYSRTVDVVDPTQPYAMYPGTRYEHLMLPVAEK
jgi:hypothetical protein